MKKIFLALVAAIALVSCAEQTPHPRRVEMRTTAGDIVLELSDLTPIHRDNFMQLVEERYFDSLLFHRVIENFMIQGGDPRTRDISGKEFFADGEETGDARYWEDIPAEIIFPTLYHKRGALAAAREGDNVNPERRSSRTQFYIVWGRTFNDEQLDAQQQRIAKRMTREFEATGCDEIVTSCPLCNKSIARATRLDVVDLAEVVAKNIV